jgi:hypothetical protein
MLVVAQREVPIALFDITRMGEVGLNTGMCTGKVSVCQNGLL